MNSAPAPIDLPKQTRRSFMAKGVKIAAAASSASWFRLSVYGQSQAPSSGKVLGANARNNVDYLSVGAQGMVHVKSQKEHATENNIGQISVCDVYRKRLDVSRAVLALNESAAYGDYRRLLERKDIDGVVATDREITDTTHLLAEFPSGPTLVVGSTVNEQGLPEILRGRKTTLHFASSQNRVELKPEGIFSEELAADDFSASVPTERIDALEKDFFDCIRNGQAPVADVDLAIRAQTVLCLAEMSERLGLTLFFDAEKRCVTNASGHTIASITYETKIPKLVG